MGKVGYILAFSNDGEVEDVTQSTQRLVTKRMKKSQVFSNIFHNSNGFLIDWVKADSILSLPSDRRQTL